MRSTPMMCCFMFRTQIWGTADISSGKQRNKKICEKLAVHKCFFYIQ